MAKSIQLLFGYLLVERLLNNSM